MEATLSEPSNGKAALVTLESIAPSLDSFLDSSPAKLQKPHTEMRVTIEPSEKNEVKFITDNITSKSSSASSSSDEDEEPTKFPDGGWGWVVVFASLVLSMIADGISFSFGLLYIEFLEEFKASSSTTSWIGSLFMAVPLLTGPIMSALVDKYGCRSMTILGGLISAFGFILSTFVNSIGLMYCTFGILSGLGLGLIYVTAVVSIAFWFDKKRTLAVGIGASGTGVGTFVFSPITSFLINEYGWRGATLLLSGSFLNMCICGMLMRDPDWITEQNKSTKSDKSSKTSLMSISSNNIANSLDLNELKNLLKSGKNTEFLLQNLETSMQSNPDENKLKSYFHSVLNLPTFIKEDEKVPIEVLEQLSSNKRLYNIILENYPSLLLCRSTSENGLNKLTDSPIMDRVPVTLCMKLKQEKNSANKNNIVHQSSLPEDHVIAVQEPLLNNHKSNDLSTKRNASFPWLKQNIVQKQHYFKNIKLHRQSLIHRGAYFNTNKYRFKASSCPNIYKVSMMTLPEEGEERWYTEFVELMKGMCEFSLFLELHFLLMSLSTIVLFIWFIVPYFYLADLMISFKYTPDQASITISVIGITNTIGMILLGWAGDQHWMNITKTYAVCLVFCGISIAGMMYFIENHIMLEICAGLFGLFLSSTFSFTPGILVELMPLEKFTVAYGLQLLCMGIGILVGPPYAGYLNDVTHTWDQSFYQAAIWTVMSGILIYIIPYSKNRKICGDGDVEKEVEGAKDNVIFLIIHVFIMAVLIAVIVYMTVICFV